MQLELAKQTATLLAFTPRTEHHGPELESRATLKFLVNVTNDFLIEIDPRLRTMLYEKADDTQEELLGDAPLTKLRIPALSDNFPLKSSWKGIGYELGMDVGISGKSNINMDLCNVDKIRYTPKDGGTVELTFNIACDPSERDVGTLYSLMGKKVTLSLVPPSAEKMAEMNKAAANTEPLFKEAPGADSKDAQVAALNELFGSAEGESQSGEEPANDGKPANKQAKAA